MTNHKQYLYQKGTDAGLDGELAGAQAYGKVRVGKTSLFWRYGLRWYRIPMENLQRIYRRVEPVYGKLCCGGRSFLIEWLVLVKTDGSELVLHIGDDAKKEAEALMICLADTHPQLQYGKVYD